MDFNKFLKKRKNLLKAWPYVGIGIPLLLIGLYLWFYFKVPLLVNIKYVGEMMKTGQLELTTIKMMAIIMPAVVSFLFATILIMLIYQWLWIEIEKKYIQYIDELKKKIPEPPEEKILE